MNFLGRDLATDKLIQPETFGDENQLQRSWIRRGKTWQLEIYYEAATKDNNERMKMEMTMPNLSYFSIGFGGSMYRTDMIAWHSNGDDSYERDYYSYSKKIPELDEEQNLVNGGREFILKDPDVEDSYDIVKFVTYRDLDTNDSEKDFLVPLNEEIDIFAHKSNNLIYVQNRN